MNPFIIRGYSGRRYFCDRERESATIMSAIANGRDITLVSLRKMGKTGLLFHVFERLKKEGMVEPVYIDIYHTENLNGLIDQLATALFRMKRSFGERMQEFLRNFRFVRPSVSVDPQSGLPSLSFQIADAKEARSTLEDLFAILQERGTKRPVVIAIDEFQQIAAYPEQHVEALLRGLIQSLTNTRFIFSGSNKTLLTRMFGDAARPFYQSTEMMFLDEIEPAAYEMFIVKHLSGKGAPPEPGVATEILHWCRHHTWYVQYLCNKLYETDSPVNMKTLQITQQAILSSLEPFYFEYRNLLTYHQWQLLKALAKTNGANMLTSGGFIKKFNLSNASTIRRGIESLSDKEMIFRRGEDYYVYDVFFSRWLEGK
jgi:uncharacterized protein